MDKKNVNISKIQEYHSIILNILNIIINQKTTWFEYNIQLNYAMNKFLKNQHLNLQNG